MPGSNGRRGTSRQRRLTNKTQTDGQTRHYGGFPWPSGPSPIFRTSGFKGIIHFTVWWPDTEPQDLHRFKHLKEQKQRWDSASPFLMLLRHAAKRPKNISQHPSLPIWPPNQSLYQTKISFTISLVQYRQNVT